MSHPPRVRYRALSYRFAVHCDDGALGRRAAAVLGSLRDSGVRPPGAPLWRYRLCACLDGAGTGPVSGRVDVWRDGTLLAADQGHDDALGWVVWDVNRSAAEASGHHLLFHAAAVEAGGNGIVLPGASGSGKSTVAAALAEAGLSYLTDELTALDLSSGALIPYPKPITVKPGSFAALAGLRPGRAGAGCAPPPAGAEWQVPVGGVTRRRVGRPCRPVWVVLPRYDAAAPTALVPLSATQAFLALALNAVNLLEHGTAGTAALGATVAGATCVSLPYSDLDAACALVLDLVGTGAGPDTRQDTGPEAYADAV